MHSTFKMVLNYYQNSWSWVKTNTILWYRGLIIDKKQKLQRKSTSGSDKKPKTPSITRSLLVRNESDHRLDQLGYKWSVFCFVDDFKFDTRLVLINAIHFKGQWLEPFLRSDTKYLPFYVTKSNYISVPTMYQKYVYLYGDLKDWKAKFLEISYAVRYPFHFDPFKF